MLKPLRSRQVCKSGALAPSRVLSCASDRPFVFEPQVCSLSTGANYTVLGLTIIICCNRTAHSQHCLRASVKARELNLKCARATGESNHGPFAPPAECITTRPSRDCKIMNEYMIEFYNFFLYPELCTNAFITLPNTLKSRNTSNRKNKLY